MVFTHPPLPGARYTRVIYLEPAAVASDPIHCRLEAIPLKADDPEWDGGYTALSYAWDSFQGSRDIYCHGQALSVTVNCDAALRQLRDKTDVMKLWVDSICINQKDEAVEERNAQVAIMGDIYKSARHVVVWLGPSDDQIKAAFNTLLDLVPAAEMVEIDLSNRRQFQTRLQNRIKALSHKFVHLHSRLAS